MLTEALEAREEEVLLARHLELHVLHNDRIRDGSVDLTFRETSSSE